MAERFRRVEPSETALALAVEPVDALTGEGLGASATVAVDGVAHDPVLNPSGYWLFLSPPVSLPPDPVTVRIDAGPEYVPVVYERDVDALSPPGLRLDVFPSVSYPFASGRTLVLGRVTDAGDPVHGATVTVEHAPTTTRTGTDGQFALAVDDVAATTDDQLDSPLRVDPTDENHPRKVLVKPDHGPVTEPRLVVTHPDGRTVTVEQSITEGERTIRENEISF
ncbi:MAG: carboxypeptidase-like regulatory domain-containing protein [Haloferacaceae archaeon]